MRALVIGGSGHVGTYLVPRLVEAGYEVVNVSRGQRQPYQPHAAWAQVRQVSIERGAAEQDGSFGAQIAALQPDVVIDMVCFTLPSAQHLVEALRGKVQHYLLTGTMWVHGHSVEVPTTEEQPRAPFGSYGIQKAAIEAYLWDQSRRLGFPATVLHPGHIVGRGWAPINPAGHNTPAVFSHLAAGRALVLPNLGMETLHHVHADDVARLFMACLAHWSAAVGQSFHAVSPAALTLRGYAEAAARWFGREAKLTFLPWEAWREIVTPPEAAMTWDHIAHSPCGSMAKAQRLLGYEPRYSSLAAIHESVGWLVEHGVVDAPTFA